MAEETGMTRQGLQKVPYAKGNPCLDNINPIMQAMNYQLMPRRLQNTAVCFFLGGDCSSGESFCSINQAFAGKLT